MRAGGSLCTWCVSQRTHNFDLDQLGELVMPPSAGAQTCPIIHDARYPMHTPEFAADPHGAYQQMRALHGALAPVELAPGVPATLVLGYELARAILHDPMHYPADPRQWQESVPADSPILPMVEWRPNALRSTGEEHRRYRAVTVDALEAVDLHALHAVVEQAAVPLINSFCGEGQADLLTEYVRPLVLGVLNTMVGCPPEIGEMLVEAFADMFDASSPEAAATVNIRIGAALAELIEHKRDMPDDDIVSRLLTHPEQLNEAETREQLVTIYSATSEVLANLIGNTLLLMLTDDRFAGSLLDGSLSTRDALDEVLFIDPPLANYCLSYPRHPILLGDIWLPAHQPVVISIAACNNDPVIRGGNRNGNASHLAWSAGPHTCPARTIGYLIAQHAIDQALDALPEMQLADKTVWRPGPFHRSLAALRVVFPPCPPLNTRIQT